MSSQFRQNFRNRFSGIHLAIGLAGQDHSRYSLLCFAFFFPPEEPVCLVRARLKPPDGGHIFWFYVHPNNVIVPVAPGCTVPEQKIEEDWSGLISVLLSSPSSDTGKCVSTRLPGTESLVCHA
jgi:hypothetical protein